VGLFILSSVLKYFSVTCCVDLVMYVRFLQTFLHGFFSATSMRHSPHRLSNHADKVHDSLTNSLWPKIINTGMCNYCKIWLSR